MKHRRSCWAVMIWFCGSVASAASLPKVIKFGGQGVSSGAHANYGQQMRMGATLAIEEINANGGIAGRKVEMKFLDSKLNADQGIENFKTLVNDWGAHFLFGVDSSGVAMGIAPEVKKLDRVAIICHAATSALTEEEVYKNGNRHVFRISAPVYQDAILAAEVFAKRKDIKRWAGINANYGYGKTSWQLFKNHLKKKRPDVEFVEEQWAGFWTTDFKPHLIEVMKKKPDAIFSTPWAGEAVVELSQALLLGTFNQIKVWWQAMGASTDVMQGIAREVAAGKFQDKLWATARYVHNYPNTKRNKDFVQAFQDRFFTLPSYSAESAYSAMYVFKKAIEQTKSVDTKKIIAAIEGMEIETPAGKRIFRPEDHQAIYTVPAGIVTNDPKYAIPTIQKLQVVDAKNYYRKPPFDDGVAH